MKIKILQYILTGLLIFSSMSIAKDKFDSFYINSNEYDTYGNVDVSDDGRYVILTTEDNGLKLWDNEIERIVKIIQSKSFFTKTALARISKDGKYIVLLLKRRDSHGRDDEGNRFFLKHKEVISIWDRDKGIVVQTINLKSSEYIKSLDVDAKGELIVAAFKDNSLKVWSRKTGKLIHTLKNTKNQINDIAISGNGRYVVIGFGDDSSKKRGELHLWDRKKNLIFEIYSQIEGEVNFVEIDYNGENIVSVSQNKNISIWKRKQEDIFPKYKFDCDVKSLDLSSDGAYIVIGSISYKIKLWDIEKEKFSKNIKSNAYFSISVAISKYGKDIIGFSGSEPTQLVNSKKDIDIFKNHQHQIKDIDLSKSGQYLVSVSSADTYIRVWDTREGILLKQIKADKKKINFVNISQDGEYIVSSGGNSIKVWERKSGKLLQSIIDRDVSEIYAIDLSPNGKIIVSASHSDVKLWNSQTGEWIKTFYGKGYYNSIQSVAISETGNFIAACTGHKVKVWDNNCTESCGRESEAKGWKKNCKKMIHKFSIGSSRSHHINSISEKKHEINIRNGTHITSWNLRTKKMIRYFRSVDRTSQNTRYKVGYGDGVIRLYGRENYKQFIAGRDDNWVVNVLDEKNPYFKSKDDGTFMLKKKKLYENEIVRCYGLE